MLMAGKNLTQPNDALFAVSIERIVNGIKKTDGELADRVQQLRVIKLIDAHKYRKVKTQLPYFVCGLFSPAIRRKEHFAFTVHFVIDIDHIAAQGENVDSIKQQLTKDERVVLLFVSPSGDGLKALFRLEKKIHDAAYFSLFYKQFAQRFALQYGLQKMIDLATNDVSRCCFMSNDPALWHNPAAEAIDHDAYLDSKNMMDMGAKELEWKAMIETQQPNASEATELATPTKAAKEELSDEVLDRIKARINPEKAKQIVRKAAYQPAALELVWGRLTTYLIEMEMPIKKITPISYGRQIQVQAGAAWAELNIFYGKRGFSVVPTTKLGSNAALAKVANEVLIQFFNS